MGEEVTKTMELINEGLASLPEFTSSTWEIMLRGYVIENIVAVVIGSLIILLLPALVVVVGKYLNKDLERKMNKGDNVRGQEIGAIKWALYTLCGVVGIIVILGIAGNLVDIFQPEYSIIRDIIRSATSSG